MAVKPIPPSHVHHIATPRATEVSNGKASESPAFLARAQAEASDVPFGRLVSEIARNKPKKTNSAAPPTTPTNPPAAPTVDEEA